MSEHGTGSAEQRLEDAMSAGDPHAARQLVNELMHDGAAGSDLVADLLAPAQLASGARWHAAQWTVADEHAATAVVDAALAALEAGTAASGTSGPSLVAACAESEWHSLPARMAAQALREAGAQVRFLGPSVPADHLREYLARLQPDALVLSATMPTSLPGAARSIEAAHDVGVPVIAGGAAFGADGFLAACLGADSWLATARALEMPPARSSTCGPPSPLDWKAFLAFQDAAPAAAAAAYHGLLVRVPRLQTMSEVQVARTREDLRHILDFLAVSLLTDDRRVIADFTAWLIALLAFRGVPRTAVVASYRALAEELDPHCGALLTGLVDEAAA